MKIVYSGLAGFGTYAIFKLLHVGTVVPIRVFGEGLSLGALVGLLVSWCVYHNLRR